MPRPNPQVSRGPPPMHTTGSVQPNSPRGLQHSNRKPSSHEDPSGETDARSPADILTGHPAGRHSAERARTSSRQADQSTTATAKSKATALRRNLSLHMAPPGRGPVAHTVIPGNLAGEVFTSIPMPRDPSLRNTQQRPMPNRQPYRPLLDAPLGHDPQRPTPSHEDNGRKRVQPRKDGSRPAP